MFQRDVLPLPLVLWCSVFYRCIQVHLASVKVKSSARLTRSLNRDVPFSVTFGGDARVAIVW